MRDWLTSSIRSFDFQANDLFNAIETANHALQRTALCVKGPASAAAFPPTMEVPRRTSRWLSLGSLELFTHHDH